MNVKEVPVVRVTVALIGMSAATGYAGGGGWEACRDEFFQCYPVGTVRTRRTYWRSTIVHHPDRRKGREAEMICSLTQRDRRRRRWPQSPTLRSCYEAQKRMQGRDLHGQLLRRSADRQGRWAGEAYLRRGAEDVRQGCRKIREDDRRPASQALRPFRSND
jgi:hypothetical protein